MQLYNKNNIVIFVIFSLSFIVGLVFLIMPYTSEKPDGLEKVTEDTIGFLKKDDFKPSLYSPIPDYKIPSLKEKFDTRRYAGVIGLFVVFGISLLIGYLLKKRGKKKV